MFQDSKAFSGFAVDDLAAAKAFYGETLGLTVRALDELGLLQLELVGGTKIMVYPKHDFVPATYTILNFPVPDVDRAVDQLTKAGVRMAIFDGFPQDEKGIARDQGPTIAWFRDPAGNILSVLSDEAM